MGKAVNLTNVVNWLNMITGGNMNVEELMKVGERVFNLKRLYNNQLGISRKDDILPPRFLALNRKGQGLTNKLPPVGQLLSDYYAHRQWSEDGIPSD